MRVPRRLALVLLALLAIALGLTGWWGWTVLVEGAAPPGTEAAIAHTLRGVVDSGGDRVDPPPPPPPPGPVTGTTRARPESGGGDDRQDGASDVHGTSGDASGEAAADPMPTTAPVQVVPGATTGDDGTIVGNQGYVTPGDEVRVPPGVAWIGTPDEQVAGMLRTRGDTAPWALPYEAPRHTVEMEGFWIERTEVTEARYRDFLQEDAGVRFVTPLGDAETLPDVVKVLVGERAPVPWDVERTARQCYEANRTALHAALPDLVVVDPNTRALDAEATWARFREARLPAGLHLAFFDRAPPAHWEADTFPPGRARHPVYGVSLADATALALWAGKHVPTEVEWEYALRGPRGLDVPEGMDRQTFFSLVNGGRTEAQGGLGDTVPVDAFQDAASWVGALNLLGNVAEWTSSFLEPYPGSTLTPYALPVDRGGSFVDTDPLVVRGAYRAARYPGKEVPPEQATRVALFARGIRLARYDEPGRDRVPAMHVRALGTGTVDASALQADVYAGVQGLFRTGERATLEEPSTLVRRPGVKAVVAQPLSAVTMRQLHPPRWRPGVPVPLDSTGSLLAASDAMPVLLGLFHTDLVVLDAWAERDANRPARLRLDRADVPPGTWWIALDRGHLVLLAADLGRTFFLTSRPAPPAVVRVLEQGRADAPPPTGTAALRLDVQGGRVEVDLTTPLGNPAQPNLIVSVRLRLVVDPTVARAVSDWQGG